MHTSLGARSADRAQLPPAGGRGSMRQHARAAEGAEVRRCQCSRPGACQRCWSPLSCTFSLPCMRLAFPSQDGWTALHFGAWAEDGQAVVAAVLKAGADANARDKVALRPVGITPPIIQRGLPVFVHAMHIPPRASSLHRLLLRPGGPRCTWQRCAAMHRR